MNEYDEYGNPNIHSKHEERDGYTVKGELNNSTLDISFRQIPSLYPSLKICRARLNKVIYSRAPLNIPINA